MGVSKTIDHKQIKIKMPNPSQEPPASFKAPNQYFKDMIGIGIGIYSIIKYGGSKGLKNMTMVGPLGREPKNTCTKAFKIN